MQPKVKASRCCCGSPLAVVDNGWGSSAIFVMHQSPVFNAILYSTASPYPRVSTANCTVGSAWASRVTFCPTPHAHRRRDPTYAHPCQQQTFTPLLAKIDSV